MNSKTIHWCGVQGTFLNWRKFVCERCNNEKSSYDIDVTTVGIDTIYKCSDLVPVEILRGLSEYIKHKAVDFDFGDLSNDEKDLVRMYRLAKKDYMPDQFWCSECASWGPLGYCSSPRPEAPICHPYFTFQDAMRYGKKWVKVLTGREFE